MFDKTLALYQSFWGKIFLKKNWAKWETFCVNGFNGIAASGFFFNFNFFHFLLFLLFPVDVYVWSLHWNITCDGITKLDQLGKINKILIFYKTRLFKLELRGGGLFVRIFLTFFKAYLVCFCLNAVTNWGLFLVIVKQSFKQPNILLPIQGSNFLLPWFHHFTTSFNI